MPEKFGRELSMEPEAEYEKPYGLDVGIKNYYFRHAEKASGLVGGEGGISTSNISEKGKKESRELGSQLEKPARQGFKIRWSGLDRTLETGRAMTKGYLDEDIGKEFTARQSADLLPEYATQYDQFVDLYMLKWEENKKVIMDEMGIEGEEYASLDPTQQAEIAERAEEPITSEWLGNPDSELGKLHPPEIAASYLAVRVRRDIKLADKLKSGSEVDFFNMTHTTITEPLLMEIVELEGGQKPKEIKDIGGALGLNEGWELDVATDEDGEKTVKLFIYRVDRSGDNPQYNKTEYDIDLERLDELAVDGLRLTKKEPSSK